MRVPYMERYPSDWRSDPKYMKLHDDARTLYVHLIDALWLSEGRLPVARDALQALACVSDATWRKHADTVLSPPYFREEGDVLVSDEWTHRYEEAVRKIEANKRRTAAATKARTNNVTKNVTVDVTSLPPRASSQLSSVQLSANREQPTEEEQQTLSLVPSSTEVRKPRKNSYSTRFETRFWAHYPKKAAKRRASRSYEAAGARRDELDAKVVDYRAALDEAGLTAGAPAADVWIGDGREEDDPVEWVRMAARALKAPDPTRPDLGPKTQRTVSAARRFVERHSQNGG